MPAIEIKSLHLRLKGVSASAARQDAEGLGSALAQQWSKSKRPLSVPPAAQWNLGHAAVPQGKAWPELVAKIILDRLSSPEKGE